MTTAIEPQLEGVSGARAPLPRPGARPRGKINLTLAVGPRRADGYHDLRSVFLRIGLSDRLDARPADASADNIEVVHAGGDETRRTHGAARDVATAVARDAAAGIAPGGPGNLAGADDLVLRAARELRAELGPGPARPLAFRLEKRIPVAAGLGGGSSDAAAALELAAGAWGGALPADRLLTLAARLGSDVPFFASGAEAALVSGRGEAVTELPAPLGDIGVLLVTPPWRLSTPAVFAAFDERPQPSGVISEATDALADALVSGVTGEALATRTRDLRDANDLWPAAVALAPGLGPQRDALERALGRPVLLSGSGPTLFCLYRSAEEAASAGRMLLDEARSLPGGTRIFACDMAGPDPIWESR
jgi:4-diphosphocytidyl-2-C-methyl-D-erythritol kinase